MTSQPNSIYEILKRLQPTGNSAPPPPTATLESGWIPAHWPGTFTAFLVNVPAPYTHFIVLRSWVVKRNPWPGGGAQVSLGAHYPGDLMPLQSLPAGNLVGLSKSNGQIFAMSHNQAVVLNIATTTAPAGAALKVYLTGRWAAL